MSDREERWNQRGEKWAGRGERWADRFTDHPVRTLFLIAVFLVLFGWGLNFIGLFGGAVNNLGDVAKKEFYPEALLRKYEWFKDASAQLDKKRADIDVYQGRLSEMNRTYAALSREKWPREDREQYNVWVSEVAGVKASFNQLAGEYNAQMAKFNYRFTNVGDLPQGAAVPLPREVKPYIAD